MAIYHLNAKIISRGKGQSAIAAAAYRSGDKLRDEQTGEQKHYPSEAGRIQFTDIMAPKDAPEWAHDRGQLWNHAERAEKRHDSRLAREFEISLPHELTEQQRIWLVKDYARETFVRRGYVVDIAIHAPYEAADERNHHAHLMVTMRTLGPEKFAPTLDRSLNTREQLAEWREQWAHLANRHLERHGHEERIDHRSHAARGIDNEPTVHVGYAGQEIAARGAQSDRMDALQAILSRNEIRVEIKAIDGELADLALADELARQKRAASETPLDWTDRGGMVAQQGSALKAVRDHAKEPASSPILPLAAPVKKEEVTDARAERLAALQKMFTPRPDEDGSDHDNSRTPGGGRGGRGRR